MIFSLAWPNRQPRRVPVPSVPQASPPGEPVRLLGAKVRGEMAASPSPCGRCGALPGEPCHSGTGLVASSPCPQRGLDL